MDFNMVMENAIRRCSGKRDESNEIYPFTNENISGYINNFDLVNRSLLTVGSSGDQVINAIFYGCQDVTLLDINLYFKYYYYLKVAGILSLDLSEFMSFFRYVDYPKVFKYNNNAFSKGVFDRIKSTLKVLDYESFLFWDELFKTFSSIDIRKYMFSFDEDRTYVISSCNDYLRDDDAYRFVRDKLTNVDVNFICGDLFDVELSRKYDNIWLSSIAPYLCLSLSDVKVLVDKMVKYLSNDSKLLVSYLYGIVLDTEYDVEWPPIYDLKKTFRVLKDYDIKLESFIGVKGIKFENSNIRDSVLVYSRK